MRVAGPVLASIVSCASPHQPPPEPTPRVSATTLTSVAAPSATAEARAPRPHESNVFMQLDAYDASFRAQLAPRLGREPSVLLRERAPDRIAHDIVSYAGRRGAVLVSVGLARREQKHAHGETPKYVELLAEAPKPDERVAAVLVRLGQWLHADDRPIDVRFKAFEPVRLHEPVFELIHFILVPAADAQIGDRRIALLRVIPVVEEEYALVKMRGDGAARAWWHERQGDAQLRQRWVTMTRREQGTPLGN